MGCPECYDTFRSLLHEHAGEFQKIERSPQESREELEEQMHIAVEREDYEEAARLRDRIKELEKS